MMAAITKHKMSKAQSFLQILRSHLLKLSKCALVLFRSLTLSVNNSVSKISYDQWTDLRETVRK